MEENNKFFAMNGILGRRGFILNFLIVTIINTISFIFPLYLILVLRPEYVQYFAGGKVSISALPMPCVIWVLICAAIRLILIFPSVVRRIRDIRGNDSRAIIPAISVYMILTFCLSGSFLVLKYLYTAFIIYLMCAKGKITGQKPHSDLLKFNWGAFLGTWIWGLFNKSYKTLLMIPFTLLFAGFPYALICGMKGNKWAYKNKKYESIEELNNSQKKQTVIWAVISPFLILFIFIAFLIVASQALTMYSNNHPEFKSSLSSYYAQSYYSKVESVFDNIEVKDGDYIFSINPKLWAGYSNNQKKRVFEAAVFYTASKSKGYDMLTSSSLPPVNVNVKIISTFNGEVLAEFEDNKEEIGARYYKFNPYPSLP